LSAYKPLKQQNRNPRKKNTKSKKEEEEEEERHHVSNEPITLRDVAKMVKYLFSRISSFTSVSKNVNVNK